MPKKDIKLSQNVKGECEKKLLYLFLYIKKYTIIKNK